MNSLLKLFLAPIAEIKLQPPRKWVVWAMLLMALAGFADATFIAFEHFKGQIPPCSVLDGCENVLTSEFSTIGPVRLEWLGMLYYLVILILLVIHLDSGNNKKTILASRLTLVGFLTSIILVFLQVFIIKALCLYCLISAGTSLVLFGLGIYNLKNQITNAI